MDDDGHQANLSRYLPRGDAGARIRDQCDRAHLLDTLPPNSHYMDRATGRFRWLCEATSRSASWWTGPACRPPPSTITCGWGSFRGPTVLSATVSCTTIAMS